jgi:hypothetical protein
MKTIAFYLAVALCFATCCANAQPNLILNGGFEDHPPQECLGCQTIQGQYPAIVHHWDNNDFGCFLCDKEFKRNSGEVDYRNGNGICPIERISPHGGKSMIEMWYMPNCNGPHSNGNATHLTAKTTQILHVGHLYEVRFWLYIDSMPKTDPDWASHIGVALLPQNISIYTLCRTHNIPSVNLDTVIYNKWYQAVFRIRPLCTSKYLMIGIFEDEQWPTSRSYKDGYYYLDDISMKELAFHSAINDGAVNYCSQYDLKKNPDFLPRLDKVILHFETNAYELTPAQKAALDSFALLAKPYAKLTFEISGHTDSLGTENNLLSDNRVQSVFQYLRDEHKMADFRFVLLSMGSRRPIASNAGEAGRALNRRVELRCADELSLSMLCYRKALKAVEGHRLAEAFSFLNKWLLLTGQAEYVILHFDPRFEPLKKDKRWADLARKVRDSYHKVKYPNYAFLIDSLTVDERKAKGDLTWLLTEYTGKIPELDTVPFEVPPLSEREIIQKNREHFALLKPIFEKTGFPKKSEFGEGTPDAAFRLLYGSRDSAACNKWLPSVKKNCEEGQTRWIIYAMLYDRCQVMAGKPQRYGTEQEVWPNGTLHVFPCEGDATMVDENRARIGLPLLSDDVVAVLRK